MLRRGHDWKASHQRAVHGREEGKADYILQCANALKEVANEDVARIPEDIFVRVFLPLFAGETLEFPKEATIAGWISVAGSPYKEVDVFNKETGDVLFRCPPLFDYNGVDPVRNLKDRSQRPIADIVQMADKLMNIHPNQSIAFLQRELGQRANKMNTGAKLMPNLVRWNQVFARYGRKPLVEGLPGGTSVAEPQPAQSGPEPDAEYEDF